MANFSTCEQIRHDFTCSRQFLLRLLQQSYNLKAEPKSLKKSRLFFIFCFMKTLTQNEMSVVNAGTTRREAICGSLMLGSAAVGLAGGPPGAAVGIVGLGVWFILCG